MTASVSLTVTKALGAFHLILFTAAVTSSYLCLSDARLSLLQTKKPLTPRIQAALTFRLLLSPPDRFHGALTMRMVCTLYYFPKVYDAWAGSVSTEVLGAPLSSL